MIYNNSDITSKMGKNIDANEQLVANQFVWVLQNKREELINNLQSVGIQVDDDITPLKLKNLIGQLIRRYNDTKDPVSKKAIYVVSSMISNESNFFSQFFSNAIPDEEFPDFDEEKEKLQANPWETKKPKFSLDSAINIGNALIGAFRSGKVNNDAVSNVSNKPTKQPRKSGFGTTKIIAISVAGLMVLGVGIFAFKMFKSNE